MEIQMVSEMDLVIEVLEKLAEATEAMATQLEGYESFSFIGDIREAARLVQQVKKAREV
jgi:hypothetical protein